MNDALAFLIRHGPLVLFIAVFIEQVGLPIPAAPLLLAAGALVAAGQMNWAVAISSVAVASLLADLIWYQLGRIRGARILGFLCRISLEPDSCIRSTQDIFLHHGMGAVVVAKFVPGLSTVMPPLAAICWVKSLRLATAWSFTLVMTKFFFMLVLFAKIPLPGSVTTTPPATPYF